MPFGFGLGGGGLRFPSVTEMKAAEDWLDKTSELRKAAESGKPISPFERKILRSLNRKLGSVFSPSTLMANMANYGALENPDGMTRHKLLREAADRSVIDALIISARLHQVKHVAKRVLVEGRQKGFNIVHKRHSDPSFKPDKSVKERCNEVEEFLMRPRSDVHPGGFRDFLVRAVEGELILDRKAMVVERDRRFRPLKFHLLPPDDIKPRPEVLMPIMAKLGVSDNAEGNEQVAAWVYRHSQVDVYDAAFIQEVDGQIVGAWREGEISVDVTLPSSQIDRWFYGRSPLDRSLALTTLLLHVFNYNEAQFTVNWPEAVLALKGDVDQETINTLCSQIYASVGQQGAQRLPVVNLGEDGTGAEIVKLRDSMRDMQYAEQARFCIALKAAAWRAHPSLLNMSVDNGGTAPLISNAEQETAMGMAQEEGLHTVLDNQSQWITRELVEPKYDDLEMLFSTRELPTEQQQIEIWSKKLSNGYTIDEFRASQGNVTLEEATKGKVSGDYVNSQFFFEQMQTMQPPEPPGGETAMPEAPSSAKKKPEQETDSTGW